MGELKSTDSSRIYLNVDPADIKMPKTFVISVRRVSSERALEMTGRNDPLPYSAQVGSRIHKPTPNGIIKHVKFWAC